MKTRLHLHLRLLSIPILLASAGGSALGQDEPVPLRLWAADAPGASGAEEADIPTITVYRPDPSDSSGAAMVICPGGGYGAPGDGPRRCAGRALAQWIGDHRRGPQISPRAPIPPPGPPGRRPAGAPDRPGERVGLGCRPGPGRHPWILRWGAPRIDGGHAFRRRERRGRGPDRPPELPARPDDPRVSGRGDGDRVRPRRLEAESPGGRPVGGIGGIALQRADGHPGDAPDLHRPDQRGRGGPGRETACS